MAQAKVVRVGIIGQGRSGYDIHAAHLRTDPAKYKIVAVADPLPDRCEEARRELGVEASTDYHDVLKRRDLDLVVNSTPSHLHVPVTLEILAAGHNVLCEKPLARRAAEVDQLAAAARKAGKLLAIFQQSRFLPYFMKIREVIQSGALGRIVMVRVALNGFGRRWDWQTLQEYNGGSLLNTGPHPVDQALQLFGPGMPEVFCIMDRVNTAGDAEDHVKLILHGAGHPTIDLEISACCAYPVYTYQVYGSQGGLTFHSDQMTWKRFDAKKAGPLTLTREPLPGRAYCREKLEWAEEKWSAPKDEYTFSNASKGFYDTLHKTMTEGAPLVVTVEDVRRQIAVMEEAHRQNPMSRLPAGGAAGQAR